MAKKKTKPPKTLWTPRAKAEVKKFRHIRVGLATAAVQLDREFKPETFLIPANRQKSSGAADDVAPPTSAKAEEAIPEFKSAAQIVLSDAYSEGDLEPPPWDEYWLTIYPK